MDLSDDNIDMNGTEDDDEEIMTAGEVLKKLEEV